MAASSADIRATIADSICPNVLPGHPSVVAARAIEEIRLYYTFPQGCNVRMLSRYRRGSDDGMPIRPIFEAINEASDVPAADRGAIRGVC
jgi:hypothetical protein